MRTLENTNENVIIGKPKKKYRILVQERKSKGCKVEKMRSFMIYDFKGNSEIDLIIEKLRRFQK